MPNYNVDKHAAFMSRERDFPPVLTVRLKYCILGTPRTGSTLLARALHDTGLAGDPLEFLNPRTIRAWSEETGRQPLIRDYLADMMARRTSPNGIFGIKAFLQHIIDVFPKPASPSSVVNFLRDFDRIIVISRRDRIDQSISLFRAAATELWTSEDETFAREKGLSLQTTPEFDGEEITKVLSRVVGYDADMRRVVARSGVPILEVGYEELSDRYRETMQKVLGFLRVDTASVVIPDPPTRKLADEESARLRKAYLEFLGLQNA